MCFDGTLEYRLCGHARHDLMIHFFFKERMDTLTRDYAELESRLRSKSLIVQAEALACFPQFVMQHQQHEIASSALLKLIQQFTTR
jgi:hypothetical protein